MRRALILVACLIGALVVVAYVGLDARTYKLTSASMEPTLHCARPGAGCRAATGDRVVALKYVVIAPARGDLVAFHPPALGGAKCGLAPDAVMIKRITKIVNGRYFLEGDNRPASCDSRVWGAVPRSRLIGRVVATYWPLRRITTH